MSCCVLTAPLNIKQSERLAEQLKSLADPVRLRLLSIVATAHTGEVCACDFLGKLEKSQPTISHHFPTGQSWDPVAKATRQMGMVSIG